MEWKNGSDVVMERMESRRNWWSNSHGNELDNISMAIGHDNRSEKERYRRQGMEGIQGVARRWTHTVWKLRTTTRAGAITINWREITQKTSHRRKEGRAKQLRMSTACTNINRRYLMLGCGVWRCGKRELHGFSSRLESKHIREIHRVSCRATMDPRKDLLQ